MLLKTSHPPTRDLFCKTHAAAMAMSAWRWLVHPCGRVNARTLARAAAGYFGATGAAAVALTAWYSQRARQCESVTWAGAVSRRRGQR
eukprot:7500795-Pyramimonas_sp.AAC.1